MPQEPTLPKDPTVPKTPTDPAAPAPVPQTSLSDALSGAGEYKSNPGSLSPVLAGTGIGSAVSGDPLSTAVLTPLVLPGLFNAGTTQSALPTNRVFFDYGYFNHVNVSGVGSNAPTLVRTTVPLPPPPKMISPNPNPPPPGPTTITTTSVAQTGNPAAGFNLHAFNFGVEKTFFDGLASVYVTVPLLTATDNITGQQINGLGDVSAGFKVILYQNADSGSTLTGGMTVSFPTAHAAVSSSLVQSGDSLVPSTSTSINPTFFQPWLAGLLVLDRVWVHEYFGVIVPTDGRVATFLNSDLTIGYTAYRASGQFLSSVTPIVGVQALIPVSHIGPPSGQGDATQVPFASAALPSPAAPNPFTFADQVYITGGTQLGLGQRCLLTAAVVVPIAAPRGYTVGGMVGLNYFY